MTNPYITTPIRARMYANNKHRAIWVTAVVLSAGLVAPPLFFIAAKKGVVSFAPAAIYAAIIVLFGLIGQSVFGNPGNWIGGVLALTMITAAAHAAILDVDWKPGR
ncbi:hypothetical protein ACFYY2_29745 [Streptomyces sp. NPDC001822]|uniref:hypothetical protein n=1 Tax=Streptomyces sp. NPDC001822 TaxID=3364614 RepID=UPI00368D9B59